MTIKEARKNLGKLSKNMSDADILMEIESATLLKSIYFKFVIDNMKKAKKSRFTNKN